MADVFRVVRSDDQQEIHRSIDLIGACVQWVRNPKKLRVEQLPAGSTTTGRVVSSTECCSALQEWLPKNKNFVSDAERNDMAELIREACRNQ
jgi:hypothetical protein